MQSGAADRPEDLRAALAEAESSTRAAYQDTTRLIRLLTVIGTPSSRTEMVDGALTVLSDVYSADVTCLAVVVAGTVHLRSACGLPEDDPALAELWPAGPAIEEALSTGRPVSRCGIAPNDLPPSLAGIGVQIGAWVPLSDADAARELLILYRRGGEPFSAFDLQMLASVGVRMHTAIEARERGDAIEWLARAGPELARRLDLPELLADAATILQHLTGAVSTWVATVSGGDAHLSAHVGLAENQVRQWPRPVADVPSWTATTVPVVHDGETVAVLGLGDGQSQPFGKTATEVATILANYLAVMISNSRLYRALSDSEKELRRRATHDPLTGLANRTLAGQRIDDALTRTPSDAVGLMFCDLDKFKDVNDRLGHEAGDELIQQVATRLQRCTRSTDLLARFGGDEFVMVIEGISTLADIAEAGRRVQAALTTPFVLRGERVHVSASVGGVLGLRGQDSATNMLRDADAAMYAAKAQGPGRVEVFDKAASHRSMDRLDLRSALPGVLESGQLDLHYQPVRDMRTGRIMAFEALARWKHPERGWIPPDVFIPIAEETGDIVALGAWLLRQACCQLARWHTAYPGHRPQMSVNVSAVQLAQSDLAQVVLDTVASAGLRPTDLWLEVTEQVHIEENRAEPVAQLRAAGVHFALDDFGVSHSNLGYLQRFPVECIKVDKSFVDGIAEREADQDIVRAVLAIARSLDLVVVAEGIETVVQRDTLLDLGCWLGQGYLLGRPLPADAATALLGRPALSPIKRAGPDPVRRR